MKRPARNWEVTDPTVGPYYKSGRPNRARPLTTHADLIAAAVPMGEVTVQWLMVDLPDDGDIDHKWCRWCSPLTPDNDLFWQMQQAAWQEEMTEHGVEWDPTIRF